MEVPHLDPQALVTDAQRQLTIRAGVLDHVRDQLGHDDESVVADTGDHAPVLARRADQATCGPRRDGV